MIAHISCEHTLKLVRFSMFRSISLPGRPPAHCRISLLLAVCLFAAGGGPVSLSAQTNLSTDMELLGLNAGLGAVTSGLFAALTGSSVVDAALGGAMGGAISFGGKRLIASDPDLGLVARQLSAVGASIAWNASEGRGWLDRLSLPAGPVWLEITIEDGLDWEPFIDVNALGWVLYGLLDSSHTIDAGRSLRAGAFVFLTDDLDGSGGDSATSGLAGDGAVFLSRTRLADSPRTIHHELTHVLQIDYLKMTLDRPLEGRVSERLFDDDGPWLGFLRVGVLYYPLQAVTFPLLEGEASRLEGEG